MGLKGFFVDPANPGNVYFQETAGCIGIESAEDMIAKLQMSVIGGMANANGIDPKGKKKGEVCQMLFDIIMKKVSDAAPGSAAQSEVEITANPEEIPIKEELYSGEAPANPGAASQGTQEAPRQRKPRAQRTVTTATTVEGPSARTQDAFLNQQLSSLLEFAEECGCFLVMGRKDGATVFSFERE